MKKLLENPYISLIARLVVGCIFIYAAIGKIDNPEQFAKEISNYRMTLPWMVNMMAIILPWLEFVMAIFIITGIRLRANAIISSGLLLIFIFAVLSAMFRNLDINCGCFAKSITKVGWPKVLENVGLLLASVYVIINPNPKFGIEKFFNKHH